MRYIEFDGGACDRDAGMRVDSLIQIRGSGAVGSPAMISCLIGAGAVPLIAIAPGASGARWRSQQDRSLTPGPPSSEPGSWGQGQGAAILVA